MTPVPTHNLDLNLFPGTEPKEPGPRRKGARPARLARLGATALVLLLLVGALFAAPSSASFGGLLGGGRRQQHSAPAAAREAGRVGRAVESNAASKAASESGARASRFMPSPFAPFQLPGAESVATYAADCTTPKTSFALGETVCAQVRNAPVGAAATLRFVQLVNTEGHIVASVPVNTSSQDTSFTLPSAAVAGLGGLSFDNRGRWRVNLTDTEDANVRSSAPLIVHDPDPEVKVSDLQITRSQVGSTVPVAGQNISFEIHVYNAGPDAAANVRFTDSTLANTTFVSLTKTRGTAPFTCTTPAPDAAGTSTCTAASMAEGEEANFIVVYKLGSGIVNDSDLTGTTSVTSDTTERRGDDNDSTSESTVKNPTPPACTLSCPDNVTVANATGQGGAFVTFAAPTAASGCGTTAPAVTPASGSFFAIGSSVVHAELPGGQSCSFIVTVNDEEDPSVSCPQDISVFESAATPGSAAVSFNVPATDNSGEVNVSCSNPSGSSFNLGTTPVTCTASDASGNTSECTFNVTVEPRAAGCTLATQADIVVDAAANACGANVNFDVPAAEGETCGTVSCDRAPGSFFPVGETVVTCTSRPDGASTDFKVTVRDKAAPVPDVATLPTVKRDCVVTLTTIPTATDNCGGKIGASTSDPRTYDDPGTYTVNWTFTDEAGNTTTQPQTVIVTGTDTTPPTVTAPPSVTLQTGPGSTACSVTVADVDALLGEADAFDSCSGASVVRGPVPAGGVFPVGVTNIVYTATDGSGNTAQATQTVTVVDNTLPTVSLLGSPTMTHECHAPFADPGAAAADNCAVEVVKTGAVDPNTPGTYTLTYRAKDASGNLSAATVTRTVTVVDTTAPAISCPANVVVYLPLNSTATSMPVSYPAPTALDSCGDAEVTTSHPSGSVFPVGPTAVTATATDDYNNSSSCTFTVTVLYNFTGFFQPVGNIPVLNQVKSGQAVPVKFTLSGNKGLGIFAAGSPASAQVSCGTDAAVDLEDTLTAGGSTLSYDASGDQYSYVWKTEKAWAGTCRQLVVTLNDGTVHRANFKFK